MHARAAATHDRRPGAIVTVGGAITEIVYALGLEDRLVGIDTTSLYPPQALQQKPNVGYMRQLSAEGVLGLNPELILATAGLGPEGNARRARARRRCRSSWCPRRFSEDGILERIRIVAASSAPTRAAPA